MLGDSPEEALTILQSAGIQAVDAANAQRHAKFQLKEAQKTLELTRRLELQKAMASAQAGSVQEPSAMPILIGGILALLLTGGIIVYVTSKI